MKAQADLARYRELVAKDEISRQQFDQAEAAAKSAAANVDAKRATAEAAARNIEQAQARLEEAQTKQVEAQRNRPQQIAIQSATVQSKQATAEREKTLVDQAALNLSYTKIVAPIDGVIGKKNAEAGQQVSPGQQLMAVVPLNDLWVTANFKETQLQKMHAGQRATIHVDAYDRDYEGYVESLAGASGARFSLLPPENATGNYVKVVQRLPVRIRLKPGEDPNHLLRPGMSADPKVWFEQQVSPPPIIVPYVPRRRPGAGFAAGGCAGLAAQVSQRAVVQDAQLAAARVSQRALVLLVVRRVAAQDELPAGVVAQAAAPGGPPAEALERARRGVRTSVAPALACSAGWADVSPASAEALDGFRGQADASRELAEAQAGFRGKAGVQQELAVALGDFQAKAGVLQEPVAVSPGSQMAVGPPGLARSAGVAVPPSCFPVRQVLDDSADSPPRAGTAEKRTALRVCRAERREPVSPRRFGLASACATAAGRGAGVRYEVTSGAAAATTCGRPRFTAANCSRFEAACRICCTCAATGGVRGSRNTTCSAGSGRALMPPRPPL